MKKPLVTIALPVYNGEKYIRKALDSVINQTYKNLEIIISDNCSTDSTKKICEEYAVLDSRIFYERQAENRGAIWNLNHGFFLSKGKYIKWAAHDDILEGAMVEECVKILEENKDIALCHTPVKVIDADGVELFFKNLNMHFMQECPAERFKDFLNNYEHRPWVTATYGLFRREQLAETKLWRPYLASDIELTAETAVIGKVYQLEKSLSKLRLHPGKSTMIKTRPELIRFIRGKTKRKFLSNYFRWFSSLAGIIKNIDVPRRNKIKVYLKLWFWLLTKPKWLLSEVFHFISSFPLLEKIMTNIRFFFMRNDFEKSENEKVITLFKEDKKQKIVRTD